MTDSSSTKRLVRKQRVDVRHLTHTCRVTFAVYMEGRFTFGSLLPLPAPPEHQHLMEQTATADRREQQVVPYRLRSQEKANDFQ